MAAIACTSCRRPYPEESVVHRCPTCGGVYDYTLWPSYDPSQVQPRRPGLWRYAHALGLPPEAPEVTLGEGNTPLVWRSVLGRQVAFKLEFVNPSGSYKDRGAATLVSFLRARGVDAAVEDSSGNAGAAFAAYAAAAGLRARLFVPDGASPAKRRQIEAYGAEVVRVLGPRSNAAQAVLRAAEQGAIYASHALLPQVMPGYATIAYELFEQLEGAPGALIAPVGQGSLLLALGRGFYSLQQSGLIERMPRLVGAQALACAPLWALFHYGPSGLGLVSEGETLAEGVRVRWPARGEALLDLLGAHQGLLVAVEEAAILPGQRSLASLGFYVEPTSALVWNALEQVAPQLPDPIVVVLTGSGLKSPL